MRASRPYCAGLLLSTPKRRPRCRLCSPRQGEMRQNHRAQQRACGRAAPLGSPQSCPRAPHRCLWHVPANISVLSLSAELSWGPKASGRVVLCSPCSRASAWAPCPSYGGLQSPSAHRPPLCAAVRETLSLGMGIPSLPVSPPRARGWLQDWQAALEIPYSHRALRAWGL